MPVGSADDMTVSPDERPFRIAIDARPLAGPPCGYTIYIGSMIECLRKGPFDVTLLGNQPLRSCYNEADGLDTRIFGSAGHLRWEQRDLPQALASERYDIYFTGANRGIPLRKVAGTRYVLGLLDVIPYLFFKNYFLARWKTLVRHPGLNKETVSQLISVARADAILTISQASARDIARLFHRHTVEAHLIRLKDVTPTHHDRTPKNQFVYVGGLDFRKKVDVLLRAFALFSERHRDHQLVLVGSNYAAMLPLITELALTDRVVLTGYVDHDTKFRILGESRAMVYPSLYEGYGMAIAEGFQAGLPVIAGRGGSQEEIGGVGARLIDPSSVDDLVSAMEEMLDPDIRAGWIARGETQLARLTDPAIETAIIDYFCRQGRFAHGRAVR